MHRFVVALIIVAIAGCASSHRPPPSEGPRAPLFNDLGSYHRPITTRSPLAQRYFDQGFILTYGFNHAEAGRAFRQATQLDPDCAMCWWGVALVLGPNINLPMNASDAPAAYDASRRALALAPQVSDNERAYIEALVKRYPSASAGDRSAADAAYAGAMRDVTQRFPDDLDAAALAAEAAMDLHPWDFWNEDGTPQPWTPEILQTIESVLQRDPQHPGAIHFYIHATEASPDPGRAAAYADRLGGLAPGAGHLVHMPSHTYIRIGRYHDAVLANIRATQADNSYVTQCRAQGVYPLAYVPHNHHFLFTAASMEGWSAKAIEAAKATDAHTQHDAMRDPELALLQPFSVMPLFAYVRFGKWDEILATPAPAGDLLYPNGIWHYARGRAFAARGDFEAASGELGDVRQLAARKEAQEPVVGAFNSFADVLNVAADVLDGEIAAAQHEYGRAIVALRRAVAREDALHYQEPPDWQYPARHSLGAVLLAAGRPREAEAVYREDLKRNPDNGWALFGLMQSLEAQGKTREAAATGRRFEAAWQHADVVLTASRI